MRRPNYQMLCCVCEVYVREKTEQKKQYRIVAVVPNVVRNQCQNVRTILYVIFKPRKLTPDRSVPGLSYERPAGEEHDEERRNETDGGRMCGIC